MKTQQIIRALLICLFCFNCSYDSENDFIDIPTSGGNSNNPNSSVNFQDDIQPIMQSSCIGCHNNPPVNGAPFGLVNYNQVSQRATSVFNSMNRQSGTPGAMPPSGRLPQSTINLIQEWIDNGKPEDSSN